MFSLPQRPLIIAHRAANDLLRLADARALGVDVIEGDVWLHRDRLEIRHKKTAGPLPLLWDKWSLASGWSPRLELSDLLRSAPPGDRLMLDLKGWNPALPARVLAALRAEESPRTIAICAQTWEFVDQFRDIPNVTRVYSIGSARMLRRFAAAPLAASAGVISINARLITEEVARQLRRPDRAIITWNVPTFARAEQLLELGVDGIITEDTQLIRQLKGLSGR